MFSQIKEINRTIKPHNAHRNVFYRMLDHAPSTQEKAGERRLPAAFSNIAAKERTVSTYAKSARTKQHIFQVAFDLFLEKGYYATSLKEIAKAANVSVGTLYRYFPSKSDLLFQIRRTAHDHLREVVETLPDDMPLTEKFNRVIMEDLASIDQSIGSQEENDKGVSPRLELALAIRHETYSSFDNLGKEEEFRHELRLIYQSLIENEQEKGRFDPTLDAKALSHAASALYFQALDRSILHGGINVADAVKPAFDILFQSASGDEEAPGK